MKTETVTISKEEYERLKALEKEIADEFDYKQAEKELLDFVSTRKKFDWKQAWEEVKQERHAG